MRCVVVAAGAGGPPPPLARSRRAETARARGRAPARARRGCGAPGRMLVSRRAAPIARRGGTHLHVETVVGVRPHATRVIPPARRGRSPPSPVPVRCPRAARHGSPFRGDRLRCAPGRGPGGGV